VESIKAYEFFVYLRFLQIKEKNRRNSRLKGETSGLVVSRGDATNKTVQKSEQVCSKRFVFGEPALDWNQFHVDWVPTVALGKKEYVTFFGKTDTFSLNGQEKRL